MNKKQAWKVEQKLIDRFLNVLADNDFKWRTGCKANEFNSWRRDETLFIIESKPKTLTHTNSLTLSHEKYNITEVTEELLKEMESEGATIDILYYNPVNHPSHYNHGELETITIIQMLLTEEEYRGYLKGNILKYRERAPYKGNAEQDYAKAKWYFDELLKIGF